MNCRVAFRGSSKKKPRRARTRMPTHACCRVRGCRHASTHVTMGHRCGACGRFGHGQLECLRRDRISELFDLYKDDRISTPCDVSGCRAPWTHAAVAHHCDTCHARGGCECSAPSSRAAASQSLSRRCPTCRQTSDVDVSVSVFTGTDCAVCLDAGPVVVFSTCRHATVCAACVERLED